MDTMTQLQQQSLAILKGVHPKSIEELRMSIIEAVESAFHEERTVGLAQINRKYNKHCVNLANCTAREYIIKLVEEGEILVVTSTAPATKLVPAELWAELLEEAKEVNDEAVAALYSTYINTNVKK